MTDMENGTAEQNIPPRTHHAGASCGGRATGEEDWLPRTTGVKPENFPAASPLAYPRKGDTSTNRTTFFNTEEKTHFRRSHDAPQDTIFQRKRGVLVCLKRITSSPLSLFVSGIRAHDKDDAAAPDNLTLVADATDAGANLHTCDRGDGRPRLQREQGN